MKLIHAIWKGAVRPVGCKETHQLNALIGALVPVPFHIFEVEDHSGRPFTMMDDVELMPGISLGDVIAEELDIHLANGTLLIFCSPKQKQDISHTVGNTVGEFLLATIGRAVFPLSSEDQVLYMIGMAYHDGADRSDLLALGLDPKAFRAGLATALRSYWSLRPSAGHALFTAHGAAPDLPDHLRALEKAMEAMPHLRHSLIASVQSRLQMNFNQWILRLKGLIDLQQVRTRCLPDGNVGIA